MPAHEGGRHKNLRCLFANIASPERFQGLDLFLKKEFKTKEKGKSVTKESMDLGVRIAWFKNVR